VSFSAILGEGHKWHIHESVIFHSGDALHGIHTHTIPVPSERLQRVWEPPQKGMPVQMTQYTHKLRTYKHTHTDTNTHTHTHHWNGADTLPGPPRKILMRVEPNCPQYAHRCGNAGITLDL
jgi:hypothetical protein